MNKKRAVISISVLILIIIILIIVTGNKNKTVKITAENPQTRNLTETVTANGTIQPKVNVTITPYISGEITELHVNEGDKVNKGDLLAKIDPRTYITSFKSSQANLNQMKASEANSKAKVSQANANFINEKLSFARNQKLYKNKVISQSEFDSAKAKFQVSKAELKSAKESLKASQFGVLDAQAKLDEASENLSRTNVYAPTDGTVAQLVVQEGERVTGNSQFSAGTVMMSVADLDSLEVHVDVNENDIVRVALQDTAIIEVDAYLNNNFKGVVTEIATSSENSMTSTSSGGAASSSSSSIDQVTNFAVKIFMLHNSYMQIKSNDNVNGSPFRPGMSANVDILTQSVTDALSIPIQAVTTRRDTIQNSNSSQDNSSKKLNEYVFILKDEKAVLTAVKTGVQNSKYIQIISGITADDKVITGPYNAISKTLKNGMAVKVVSQNELYSPKK
ncbi:MAG: efflux RND transporter periplasmic adaptor subunit [Bacteroidales bacterium]